MPSDIVYADDVFQIQGALFEVYRSLGAGFLEGIYQEALSIEFAERAVPFEALKPLPVAYKGRPLRQSFVADFVCFGRIVLELKAVRILAPEHRAQTINYLRATGLKLGLLVNFGAIPRVQVERLVL